jgi:ABC-type uncharacterized transport system auxiliary subunit
MKREAVRALLFPSLLLAATSCSFLTPEAIPERSVLRLRPTTSCEQSEPVHAAAPRSLLLLPPRASALLASERILYEKDDGSLGNFQLASWAELPTVSIARLLQEQLECSGAFHTVTREQSLTRTDYALATELSVFVFRPLPTPGSTQLRLRAELVDVNSRQILAHTVFSLSEPATESSAQGAATSHSALLSRLALELDAWLRQALQVASGE